jgi:hypothetical protein
MSTTDQPAEFEVDKGDAEERVTLELVLSEAEALHTWLLKPAADGTTSLDDPIVNGVLIKLGRAVDAIHAAANVRRELEDAGLDVAHLSDEQVRDLGRRISDAALPGIRG